MGADGSDGDLSCLIATRPTGPDPYGAGQYEGTCGTFENAYANGLIPNPSTVADAGCAPIFDLVPEIDCEGDEIALMTSYLKRRNSPLANFAAQIVTESDASGIDDRFIVALAGAESTYGKSQQTSPTWANTTLLAMQPTASLNQIKVIAMA